MGYIAKFVGFSEEARRWFEGRDSSFEEGNLKNRSAGLKIQLSGCMNLLLLGRALSESFEYLPKKQTIRPRGHVRTIDEKAFGRYGENRAMVSFLSEAPKAVITNPPNKALPI